MADYKKYINALRKCAKEHENDITSFAHIIISDLCRDTANLLESLEQEPFINKPCISIDVCHEDKVKVLGKIRDEIANEKGTFPKEHYIRIIDKYKAKMESGE